MLEGHISQGQADEYAIGALEPEVDRFIVLHLAECEACSDIVGDSRRVALALALSVPHRKAPPRLRERVMRAAGIRRPGLFRRGYAVGRAVAGIAAVFVAIAAFTGMVSVRGQIRDLRDINAGLQSQVDDVAGQKVEIAAITRGLNDEKRASAELREAAAEDRDLLLALLSPTSDVAEVVSVDESNRSIGRLVWDDEQKRIWFIAVNLPPRPEGETYQVWVNSGGRYYSLGTFDSDDKGFARWEAAVPQGLQSYESAVVTIERAGGASERSGTSVFVTDLSKFRR